MTVVNTAIIGGGLAGMALASMLHSQNISVAVLEKEARPGGKIRSVREDGFVVEMGPLGWLDREPAVGELVRSLGLQPIAASEAAEQRSLLFKGQLKPLPTGALSFIRSPLLSARSKARLLTEPFIGVSPADEESVQSFATRRFGRGVARTFFAAMVSGIFGGDPERLSVQAAFPLMASWESEAGSCVRGAIRHMRRKRQAIRRGTLAQTSGRLLTLEGGLSDLIDTIELQLGDSLRCGEAPDSVVHDGDLWVVLKDGRELLRSRRLVMATHARMAMRLLLQSKIHEGLSAEESQALTATEEIPGSPLAVVTTAHKRSDVSASLDSFGFIALRGQEFRPLGVQFASSIFPSQTPEGLIQLRTLVGGAFDPNCVELNDQDLIAAALNPVLQLLQIRGEPSHTWVRRAPAGIPQYNLGHVARVQALDRLATAMPSLSFIGDSLHGVGINKVVARARTIAAAILEI